MKIIALHLKNINSLYGEWRIDFTHDEFRRNGIFAITGPTGAGKSSLLDAISLALYRRTPRISSFSKETNDVMSRETGVCFAELEFETASGQFRARWEQHRSREKADGTLQNPSCSLAELSSGKIIASKTGEFDSKIESVTGMSFEQFSRACLLAQGEFAAFLKAKPEKRAPILEQITGTRIYSELSILAYNHADVEEKKLAELREALRGLNILSDEQRTEKEANLQSAESREKLLAGQTARLSEALAWLRSLNTIRNEISSVQTSLDAHVQAESAFEPDRIRLERAESAAVFDAPGAEVELLRKNRTARIAEMEILAKKIPILDAGRDLAETLMRQADLAFGAEQERTRTETLRITELRLLTTKLQEKSDVSTQVEAEYRAAQKQTVAKQTHVEKITRTQHELEQSLSRHRQFLSDHESDAALDAALPFLREHKKRLDSLRDVRAKAESAMKQAARAAAKHEKELTEKTAVRIQKHIDAEAGHARPVAIREKINLLLAGKTLRDCKADCDALRDRIASLTEIASLADRRAQLTDGMPCPLCGATHHPYNDNTPSAPDPLKQQLTLRINQIRDIETFTADLVEAEKSAAQLDSDARNAQHDEELAQEKARTTTEHAKELRDAFEAASDAWRSCQNEWDAVRTERRIPSDADPIEFLEQRLTDWRSASAECETARNALDKARTDLAAASAECKALAETLAGIDGRRSDARKALEELKKQRKDTFGDMDPDSAEKELETARNAAETALKRETESYRQKLEVANTVRTRLETLKEQEKTAAPLLAKAETDFRANLAHAGFPDEAAYLQQRLSAEERTALRTRAEGLRRTRIEQETALRERTARLAAEEARNLTGKTENELLTEQADQSGLLNSVRDEIATHKLVLAADSDARKNREERMEEIRVQETESARWGKLARLIGSAKGDSFQRFAQGLTFDIVIRNANRVLAGMTDRYLLTRSDAEPLALNVTDLWMAGEVRTTANLSGGESFLVSLALALGLSEMSGEHIRIDSLFLDEGFGTLDADSLDDALALLANLHREGKLIGLISHVGALRDRIPVQLAVTPLSGGRSALTGPGVSRMA